MGIVLEIGDYSENQSYVSRRLAIGVALLILYLVHFIFQLVAYFSLEENGKVLKHKFDHLSKRLYLLGIAMLISYNYLQGGVFEAILAWFTLVIAIVLHFTTLKTFSKPPLENKLWIAYYVFMFTYFIGIIISFYSN